MELGHILQAIHSSHILHAVGGMIKVAETVLQVHGKNARPCECVK